MNVDLPFAPTSAPVPAFPETPPAPQGRRYLAVSLPRLATDRIARLRWGPGWRLAGRPDVPIVVTGKRDNAQRLVALNETAAAIGLARGQSLTDARAMVPAIEPVAEDMAADRLLLEAIADWCDRYTPLVALDPPDPPDDEHNAGLMLDITGCAHLFGGEKALLADLLSRLFHQGFAASVAIAATPGAAWAIARFATRSRPGSDLDRMIVPGAGTARALIPLPLAALRLDAATVAGLDRLGLRCVGHLLERPRAPLARRFGRQLLLRLDQALGAVEEAISPRLPLPDLAAERRLAEPVADSGTIAALVLRLAGHLGETLEKRGRGARLVDLALFRADGHVLRLGVGTSRPLRDAAALARLFDQRLAALGDDFDPGYGFDMLRLSVRLAQELDAAEPRFFSGNVDPRPVLDLIDRLGARLGLASVMVGLAGDTHLPERAESLLPACENLSLPAQPRIAPASEERAAQRPRGAVERSETGVSERTSEKNKPSENPPSRPLRLFARPEPVEAIARVPDGPPARFRWRRVLHEIVRAEGPERIADEWWHDGTQRPTRDYFRVEDEAGRRFWLFREGLYGTETAAPRWYVHGMFA